ncbi:MAG: hypothetical protein ILO36_03405 [Abditibacteriota bacterium]|nr:hypothetical protein [Abditibacteriota bacterium]
MKVLIVAFMFVAALAAAAAECELSLPPVIPVVKGREVRLHYYNICRCNNIDNYIINSSLAGDGFDNLADSLRITAEKTGDHPLSLAAIDSGGQQAASASCIVRVVEDGPKPAVRAIFIGDSLTHAAVYQAELKNLMGDALVLYGTRTDTKEDSEGNSREIRHEGRSSWAWRDYTSLPEKAGMANSFFDPEKKDFSFSYYMEQNKEFGDATDVFLLSGPNDGGAPDYIVNLKKITDSIRSYSKTLRIHIMLPLPNCNDGYAWGVRNHGHYLFFKNAMFGYCREIIDMYGKEDNISIIATNANIDCKYDFPRTQVPASSRNPMLVDVVNENVHPNQYGYYRMADMIYADILANCR